MSGEDPATEIIGSRLGGSGGCGGGVRGAVIGNGTRSKETDGEILLLGSELDWFGHFTHTHARTHHTSHTSRVMVGGCGG